MGDVMERPVSTSGGVEEGPKLVLVCSPKGGSGKTTLSRLLLAQAVRNGQRVAGLDLDPQRSLGKWFRRRQQQPELRDQFGCEGVEGYTVLNRISQLRKQIEKDGRRLDLIVVDTPPAIEVTETLRGLIRAADLVLVPVQATPDDMDAAVPWMAEMRKLARNAAFVQSRVKKAAKRWEEDRARLSEIAKVCHTIIPDSEEVCKATEIGAIVHEIPTKTDVQRSYDGVWNFVRQEVGL